MTSRYFQSVIYTELHFYFRFTHTEQQFDVFLYMCTPAIIYVLDSFSDCYKTTDNGIYYLQSVFISFDAFIKKLLS